MAPQPEQQARGNIDRLLAAADWHVCAASAANIHAARGVAIREVPLPGYGFASCLLYVVGKQTFGFFCEFARKITYRTTSATPKQPINELWDGRFVKSIQLLN